MGSPRPLSNPPPLNTCPKPRAYSFPLLHFRLRRKRRSAVEAGRRTRTSSRRSWRTFGCSPVMVGNGPPPEIPRPSPFWPARAFRMPLTATCRSAGRWEGTPPSPHPDRTRALPCHHACAHPLVRAGADTRRAGAHPCPALARPPALVVQVCRRAAPRVARLYR